MGFEIDLELPDVSILSVNRDKKGNYLIELESTNREGKCRQCGQVLSYFKGYSDPIQIRHLPILGKQVMLKIRPRRYQCFVCETEPTTVEELSWRVPGKSYTQAYQDHVLRSLIQNTIEMVSLLEGIGAKQIESMLEGSSFSESPLEHLSSLPILGLDEIALKKGHQDFVVIVSAQLPTQTQVLAVLPDRKKQTVFDYLEQIPESLKATIETVCVDMYDGYSSAVQEALGDNVAVVVDRFHVAQAYRKGADELRKQEQHRLKKELPPEEYHSLKGLLWAFRKNPEALTDSQKTILSQAFQKSPSLEKAYQLRNDLTEIFEKQLTPQQAMQELQQWELQVKESGLSCFDAFLKTLNRWSTQITNYFKERKTSAFVEGLNNKIKVIKRRCYGILNLNHLFQRIRLDTSGVDLLILNR